MIFFTLLLIGDFLQLIDKLRGISFSLCTRFLIENQFSCTFMTFQLLQLNQFSHNLFPCWRWLNWNWVFQFVTVSSLLNLLKLLRSSNCRLLLTLHVGFFSLYRIPLKSSFHAHLKLLIIINSLRSSYTIFFLTLYIIPAASFSSFIIVVLTCTNMLLLINIKNP